MGVCMYLNIANDLVFSDLRVTFEALLSIRHDVVNVLVCGSKFGHQHVIQFNDILL